MENLFATSKCLTKEQMKRYLQKQMNRDKQITVERHLVDCALCSTAIDGYTNHYNFESDQTFENLDGFLKEKEQMMKTKTATIQPRSSARFNRIAASLLFFLIPIAGFMYWNATSTDRLFSDHFSGAENFSSLNRGSEAAAKEDQTLGAANELYRKKDFVGSAALYSEYLDRIPENPRANFFAGVSFLEINEVDKAIEQLTIARMNSTLYYEEASWYLILANLKIEDKAEAKVLINELLQLKSGRYREQLKEMLEAF